MLVSVTKLQHFHIYQPIIKVQTAAASTLPPSILRVKEPATKRAKTAAKPTPTPVINKTVKWLDLENSSGSAKAQQARKPMGAPVKKKRQGRGDIDSDLIDLFSHVTVVSPAARVNTMTRSAHNSLNFDEPKTPAPNIMASWCVYEMHEEKWAKMLLPDAFMAATINLHSKACSVLASKWTRPEDYIKDKYSVRTVDVEYITNHESKPTKLVMLPPESEVNKFIKGNKAEACGFATTDSEINNKHLSRCLLCPPPDGRLRSGSYKNVNSSIVGDTQSWFPPTHDEPDRTPETVPCSFSTFVPSYVQSREINQDNSLRYSELRDDCYLKQKFLNFSADCDKQVTRVIMEHLPLVKIHCPDAVIPIVDPAKPFLLYDATAGYADRTLAAWSSGGWLDNTIHMSADQVPLNRKTKDGHQSLAEFACCGFRSNDGILGHSFFSLNGLQPCTQVKAVSDFLNYHQSCTHACIVFRGIDDFFETLQGYQLALFQELPEGSVIQAGNNGFCHDKCFKYVVIKDYVVKVLMLSQMSPVSPPVPRMRNEYETDSEEEDLEEYTDDEDNSGPQTPGYGGPRQLRFGSNTTEDKENLMRSVYEPWVNTSSIFDASPGDSIMAQKGSPIVEAPMPQFEHLLTFKSGNEELINECSDADAKLYQAEQTLKDLQECEDDSAASLLAGLLASVGNDGKKKRLESHVAQINKKTAETEKRIMEILANRCK